MDRVVTSLLVSFFSVAFSRGSLSRLLRVVVMSSTIGGFTSGAGLFFRLLVKIKVIHVGSHYQIFRIFLHVGVCRASGVLVVMIQGANSVFIGAAAGGCVYGVVSFYYGVRSSMGRIVEILDDGCKIRRG